MGERKGGRDTHAYTCKGEGWGKESDYVGTCIYMYMYTEKQHDSGLHLPTWNTNVAWHVHHVYNNVYTRLTCYSVSGCVLCRSLYSKYHLRDFNELDHELALRYVSVCACTCMYMYIVTCTCM